MTTVIGDEYLSAVHLALHNQHNHLIIFNDGIQYVEVFLKKLNNINRVSNSNEMDSSNIGYDSLRIFDDSTEKIPRKCTPDDSGYLRSTTSHNEEPPEPELMLSMDKERAQRNKST